MEPIKYALVLSDPVRSYLQKKTFFNIMPLKDVSKEEQSNLYLSGCQRKETVKLTEVDKGKRVKTRQNAICHFIILTKCKGGVDIQ